jgi:transcriptional regulator with PAS, ATPase and Fis domain
MSSLSPERGAGLIPRPWMRRADRRSALPEFLSEIADGLILSAAASDLRERFERALRVLLRTERVWLRLDGPGGDGAEGLVIEVPGMGAARSYIEVGPGARAVYDEWDRQVLHAAACAAALVLAAERSFSDGRELRPPDATRLIGSSAAIVEIRERVRRVASTDFTVLIEGESGTGKELVARLLHDQSRRRRGPFVAINCAALVESLLEAELFGIEERTATGVRGRRGKFEHADQGTLFLDEVSDLSLAAQAKLLRAIQEMAVDPVGSHLPRRVDTRVVVATNRRLQEMVERGRFRLDLFYRLNGVEIVVPPLRQRRDDIPELVSAFVDRHRHIRPLAVSRPALDALLAYHWPGNVRELERVVERAVALADDETIDLDDLPQRVSGDFGESLEPSAARDDTLRAWAIRYVRLVLARHGGNRRRACDTLGISQHTLRAYLRRGLASGLPAEVPPGLASGQERPA